MAVENYLTYRQKAFLAKMHEIYREIQKPIHYNLIAKKLGLCGSTVYDMLRVLEKKGMVNSQYRLTKKDTGPGRSSIFFVPADIVLEQSLQAEAALGGRGDWDRVKAGIMNSIRRGAKSDYEKVCRSLLEKDAGVQPPLERCARLITGMLVNLKQAKYEFSENSPVLAMLKSPVSRLTMSSTAGLITGLAIKSRKACRAPGKYREQLNKFTQYLQDMSEDNVRLLHQFTMDVWNMLGSDAVY